MADKASRSQFASKAAEEVLKEPTLFYLMQSTENSGKFRQAACHTITTLLENSDMIAKWQYILERRGAASPTEIQSEGLGLFLRLIHYYVVTLVENETEYSML